MGGSVGQWVGLGQTTNNWINLDLIKMILLFEDLWFVETPQPMGGCVGCWVGQWVKLDWWLVKLYYLISNKSWPNWDNSILFEDLCFIETPPPMGGCMGQWMVSGQMTSLIKPELIDIIRFCLKIYDLWTHPHLWTDGWVNGWAHVKSLKSN